jgi:hypothetical protein
MKQPYIVSTGFLDLFRPYEGEMADYYQVHLLSMVGILSWYFDPKEYSMNDISSEAKKIFTNVKKNSIRQETITLFHKDGKYLITEDPGIYNPGELLEIDPENDCYDFPDDDSLNFVDYLGKKTPSEYIKGQLTTIGAPGLYSLIEQAALKLDDTQNNIREKYKELRESDISDPKYKLEIYHIEKNYKPVKIKEFLCHGQESAFYLPEFQPIHDIDLRISYLIKDIVTGTIVDGNLEEAIESIRFRKWQRRNPAITNLKDMMRMELDNDDPNFLSWDEYVANNDEDEDEEGDDEYTPEL